MEKANYQDLILKLRKDNIPLRAQIALTYRCNLDCVHCFESKETQDELTFFEIKEILSQLKDLGCIRLTLTGGELFLRRDILDIFEFSRRLGFGIDILTNGTLLTRDLIKQIKKFNPLLTQVSLYGATKKVHESITRVEGSYQKSLEAIRLLKSNNLRFRVATMVMQQNFHKLKNLKEMARREKWNLMADYCITPRYDGSRSPLICRIAAEQLKQVAPELKSRIEYYHKIRAFRSQQYPYPLSLGRHSCYISAQGEVFLSCTSRIRIGSLRQDSFKDIWMYSKEIENIRRLKLNDFQCSACQHLLYCCWDPGLAWLEHGDLTASPREMCRLIEIALRKRSI